MPIDENQQDEHTKPLFFADDRSIERYLSPAALGEDARLGSKIGTNLIDPSRVCQ
jgi:hypothetical protein